MVITEFPIIYGDYMFDSELISNKRKHYHYICKCGHEANIRADRVKENNKCNHPEKYIGQVFGRLKIEKISGINRNGKTVVEATCECSPQSSKEYILANILNGKTKSCGCIRSECLSKKNEFYFIEDYVQCVTSNGEIILFDIEYYDYFSLFCWCVDTKGYAISWNPQTKKYQKMHQLIIITEDEKYVPDHRNGNTLDNRRHNLRIATKHQNAMNQGIAKNNTSGKTGVHWHKNMNKWIANIGYKNKLIHLGYFDSYDDAVKEREKAEVELFKEYRRIGSE